MTSGALSFSLHQTIMIAGLALEICNLWKLMVALERQFYLEITHDQLLTVS